MRFKLIVLGLIFTLGTINAQVSNEGTPFSWSMQTKKSIVPTLMKSFDLNKLKVEDAKNDKNKSLPWRFGYELKVDLNLKNSGVWDKLENGDRIWRLNIISKEAKSISCIFDTYKIPRGATLYIYNNDRTDLLGAYTNIFNRPDQKLGTWPVMGSNVWLEYYEPSSVVGQGELSISKIIHGYRTIGDAKITQKLNTSGDCNQDVDCTVGSDFDPIKERLKHSVAFIVMQGFVCTGTLINNTSNDKAPYFLTANHCNAGDEATWAFRFNWISPDPSCGTTLNSPDATVEQTTSGATRRASNPESDFKLLSLDGGLDPSWDLEWAGWDRRNIASSFAVGIHHPSGDIMKVCREDKVLTDIKTDIGGIPDPVDSWRVEDWDIGVTEGGSSGSALFNPEGRIVGQLAGGGAACAGTDDNGLSDFYGRFNISWDFGNSDSNRLSNWLDPTNTGRETLDMLSVEGEGTVTPPVVTPPEEGEEVVVFFDTEKAVITIANGPEDVLEYIIYNISGQRIGSGQLSLEKEDIDMNDRSSGLYFVYVKNATNGTSFTRKVIVSQRL
ncbi:T9SS type A sorting domain-containing protein [Aquimarina algiphila]|uniref:T9SS type A sorting domain-containing protein n=1 Tax=Aquimarina algiphila TaxID=2047982 RepID=A0A554VPN8_9FLAO|nr:T9SS type A sorting domain-containing protein [Aquimarina algiphila]TSE10437.1 T9SS type A sorting domain-containing protein [Aquimarina algiphila]